MSSSLNIEINVFVLKIIQNQGFQENSEGVSSHGMGVAKDADIAGVLALRPFKDRVKNSNANN